MDCGMIIDAGDLHFGVGLGTNSERHHSATIVKPLYRDLNGTGAEDEACNLLVSYWS